MKKQDLLNTLSLAKALATYDGELHQAEQGVLADLMIGFEVSEEELDEYRKANSLQEALASFKDDSSREFLADVLCVIACSDGKLDEKEKKFLTQVFNRIGVTEKITRILGPEGEAEIIKIYNQIDELAYQFRQHSSAILFNSGQGGSKLETESCHVAFMDEQHTELLSRFGEYIGADTPTPAKTMEMLTFLKNYIANHFALEQQQMKKWDYPRAEVHIKEHQRYIEAFEVLLNQFTSLEDNETLKTGIIGMRDWFIKHINRFDHRMGFYYKTVYLSQRQVKKVLVNASSEEEAVEIKASLNQLGLKEVDVAFKERDIWQSTQKVSYNLIVIQRSGPEFTDLNLAKNIRQQLPGVPILYVPTQDNITHFKKAAWELRILGPKAHVARFPFRLGELAGKLHDALYSSIPKPVEL